MTHSKILEETRIWKVYTARLNGDTARSEWTKKVYVAAAAKLKAVRDAFPNYTLHDETHVLNVLDAMGGLLGTYADNLSVGEAELLILAACLHDVGMCYDDADRERCFSDEKKCEEFLRLNNPELIGAEPSEWGEDVRQNYLRSRHPFRVGEELNKSDWQKLFNTRPKNAVRKDMIIAVCQAHGETPSEVKNHAVIDGKLEYRDFYETDSLFCAVLLRLGDILDFDDTRAPQMLYSYAGNSDKSREEWQKHMASAGFSYPNEPSETPLAYSALCTDPKIEHTILNFLDWVD